MLLRHTAAPRLIAALNRLERRDPPAGPLARLGQVWARFCHAGLSTLTASDIAAGARIAPTVRFPHLTGIVIHEDVVVEDDCMIMQQVTLGQLAGPGAPHVGRGAYLGAGARVLGPVRIGAGARIGANAVVLTDVPAGATAVGIPARIVRREPAGTGDAAPGTGQAAAGRGPRPAP